MPGLLLPASIDHQLLNQCWGNERLFGTRPPRRCPNKVPPDPDHIGLCDSCRGRMRRTMPVGNTV